MQRDVILRSLKSDLVVIYCTEDTEMAKSRLNQVGNIHWHLLDGSAVEALDFGQSRSIVQCDKVDGNTLPPETTSTTDTMNVILLVGGQIVAAGKGIRNTVCSHDTNVDSLDNERYLLYVNTTGEQIGGDKDTRGS